MRDTNSTVSIEPARPKDLPAILGLLRHSGLPTDGLSDHLATALVARKGDTVVGSAALELYGEAALLRSVAIMETDRGNGRGRMLTLAALDLARHHRVKTVYLLTQAASHYFARFGFVPIERLHVAPAVQRSIEFTTACPNSAQAMVLSL